MSSQDFNADMAFNVDMTKPPIVIGQHDWERVEMLQGIVLSLSQLSVLPFRHPGDVMILENCVNLMRAIYAALHDQTWNSPELAAWWLTQHPPGVTEKLERLMRAGDSKAMGRYGQELATRYPLPRFRVVGQ